MFVTILLLDYYFSLAVHLYLGTEVLFVLHGS